jgi:hypothetical protein
MVNMNNNYNPYQNKGGRVYLCHNHHLLEFNVAYHNLNLGNFWAEIYIHGHILASKPNAGIQGVFQITRDATH